MKRISILIALIACVMAVKVQREVHVTEVDGGSISKTYWPNRVDKPEHAVDVTFSVPFIHPPTVQCNLFGLDIDKNRNLRVTCKVENVTETGCTIKLKTWADTTIWKWEANWIAFGH